MLNPQKWYLHSSKIGNTFSCSTLLKSPQSLEDHLAFENFNLSQCNWQTVYFFATIFRTRSFKICAQSVICTFNRIFTRWSNRQQRTSHISFHAPNDNESIWGLIVGTNSDSLGGEAKHKRTYLFQLSTQFSALENYETRSLTRSGCITTCSSGKMA
jgi:hypothetical protein